MKSDFTNPQTLNRYSYCLNNPLKYIDPSGHDAYMAIYVHYAMNGPNAAPPSPGYINKYIAASGGRFYHPGESLQLEPSLPADKGSGDTSWNWDDPKAAVAFGLALGLLADDIPSCGLGIPDDVVAALAALTGLAIIIGANRDYISTKINDALDALSVFFSNKQAPGMPGKKDGYVPPKNWDGKKVKNPNGPGSGYPDNKGNVWVPTEHKGTHAPHWDVQHPGGGHTPVYPKK